MATTIKLKNGSGAPLAGDLVQGEPALDLTNKRLYTEDSGGSVIEVGTNPTSLTTGTFTSTGIDDNATSTAITIDASENVGIGKTPDSGVRLNIQDASPVLRMDSTSDTGECVIHFGDPSSNFAGVIRYNHNGNDMQFYTNQNPRMTLDGSGNVGIGTTPEGWFSGYTALEVPAGSFSSFGTETTIINSNLYFAASGTTTRYKNTGGGAQIACVSDTIRFSNAPSGTSGNAAAITERMRIDASGNVGIGTSSPTDLLEVEVGTETGTALGLYAGGSLSAVHNIALRLGRNQTDPTRGVQIAYESGSFGQFPAMTFGTGNTERMRIDSSGNVGIGTPSLNGAYKLQVSSNSVNRVISAVRNDGGDAVFAKESSTGNSVITGAPAYGLIISNNSNHPMVFGINATERMRLDTSGNLLVGTTSAISGIGTKTQIVAPSNGEAGIGMRHSGAAAGKWRRMWSSSTNRLVIENNAQVGVYLEDTSTAWAAYSDETLKENISDIGPVLDTIKGYRCVNYSLKSTESDAADKVGFIAQDWENDFPNVVNKDEDGTLSMKYTETIPVLLKAIQEQQTMIEELKAEVAALKGA